MSIGINMVDILEKLHDQGFLHCDIKPDNIMIGDFTQSLEEMNKLYLIDFGLSHSYLKPDGNHYSALKDHNVFKGSLLYASKNAFKR